MSTRVTEPLASPPLRPAGGIAEPVGYLESAGHLIQCLRRHGVLGVVVVDASPLADVERSYGVEAHRGSLHALARAVAEVTAPRRGVADRILRSEVGRDEVAVAFARPGRDAGFWKEELAAVAGQLAEHLERHGARIFYPHLRQPPRLPVGWALTVHNPILDDVRQLRRVMEEARQGAALDAAVEGRRRRQDFQRILATEDVTILFEPIANLASREVLGYEALVRGPAGSDLQSPGRFFQRAEETGLLFEADSLCRRRALEAARGLPPGKKLFLNCLPGAIRDPAFHGAALRGTLERMRLRPTEVVLEISERESIGNFAIFREARDHFASLGLGIAMDDMGAGYSSLEAVMELAPDFIKVDQSLVRSIDTDPPRQELLRSLNAVAAKLDSRIIAEGIETREELETLRSLGVPLGQGYLLGRAAPLRREA